MCAHREPAYAAAPWRAGSPLVESERAQDGSLVLPLHHGLTAEEQGRVAAGLAAALHEC